MSCLRCTRRGSERRDRGGSGRAAASLAALAALAIGLGAGCGDNERPPGGPVGQCEGRVFELDGEVGLHVSPGTPIRWSSNPPATGKHYPSWAGWFRSYSSLERGYWMHNAEHGGVILLYRCPDGCEGDLAALIAVAQARPQDPRCALPVRNRVMVVADPMLPEGTKIAAVAWNAYYTAGCVDAAALTSFVDDHYGRGPEDLCSDGLPMGGTRIPAPSGESR
jgi:hypothetical protein